MSEWIFLCRKDDIRNYKCKKFESYKEADLYFKNKGEKCESYLVPISKIYPEAIHKRILHNYITNDIKINIET